MKDIFKTNTDPMDRYLWSTPVALLDTHERPILQDKIDQSLLESVAPEKISPISHPPILNACWRLALREPLLTATAIRAFTECIVLTDSFDRFLIPIQLNSYWDVAKAFTDMGVFIPHYLLRRMSVIGPPDHIEKETLNEISSIAYRSLDHIVSSTNQIKVLIGGKLL